MGANGILNVNKPCGPTSFSIVAAIRHISGEKRVGHAGTLDPAASGVLPVCLGQATRITEYIHIFSKEYIAGITFGATTDTLDARGNFTSRCDAGDVTLSRIQQALKKFVGNIQQSPPAYSAIKIGGKQSYKLARAGINMPLKPRTVTISSIDILSFDSPYLKIKVHCSTGTYIRSIAGDLGADLGCGAYLQDLIRTAYGPYKIEESLTVEEIGAAFAAGESGRLLFPVDHPLLSWQKQVLDDSASSAVLSGIAVAIDNPDLNTRQLLRCCDLNGKFLAILKFSAESGLWHPEKVFKN